MDPHITEREPTLNDIKKRIEQLNKDINKLATAKSTPTMFNIANMKKLMRIRKFNNNTYSSSDNPFQQAINQGWWGNGNPPPPSSPNRTQWGVNMFPSSIAWWIGNLPGENRPNASIRYGSNDGTKSYFYYVYDAPSAMQVYLYAVLPSAIGLKINGESKGMTPFNGDWFYGCSLSVNLQAGKNVFEISSTTGLPNSGFVFYVATSDKSTVLFKTGDPGWGVTVNPVADYTLISNNVDYLEKSNKKSSENIYQQIKDIQTLIQNVSPKVVENNTLKDLNITALLAKLAHAQRTYADLLEEININESYIASNETENLKANSNFNKYVLYLIFTILFLVGLIFVLKNPEAGNLDILMLILGLGILLYYGYEYYVIKQRSK
jgi:hypothetical protein